MVQKNHGHIVSVNSVLGLMGLAGTSDYCASKFGAVGLHEALALELQRDGKDGVKITVVHPYQTDTEMFAGTRPRFVSIVLVYFIYLLFYFIYYYTFCAHLLSNHIKDL
jgi:short-subunit dehydrogenase